MSKKTIFIFFIFYSSFGNACNDGCQPLSQVTVTQKGTEKLYEHILNNTFDSIQKQVEKVASFDDFTIDHSKCPKIKLYQAVMKKEKCLGIIDFRKYKNESPDANAELTGFKAKLDQLSLDKLGMNLVSPVKCENWNCSFRVKVKDIKISGKLNASYADTGKEVFPTTTLAVSSNNETAFYYDISMKINPGNGDIQNVETKASDSNSLNNLVHVVPGSSNFSISDAGLNFKMNFDKVPIDIDKEEIYKNSYNSFKEKLKDEKWILDQYQRMQQNLSSPYRRREILYLSSDDVLRKVKKARDQWNVEGDFQKAFNDIPKELVELINSASEQKMIAEFKYQAARYGINDYAAYSSLKGVENIANKALSDNNFLSKNLIPYLNSEVGTTVEKYIQENLRNISQYWDTLSKVPLGNGDEVAMDTNVLVQNLNNAEKLLKMNIYDKKENCFGPNAQFKKSNTDDNDDFDMQTSFSLNSLNRFFARAVADKKLKFCSKESTINCRDGVQVNIKTAPKIKCQDGKLLLDFQNNEIRPFDLFEAQSTSLVEADVVNCNGSPCVKLKNVKSQFISLPLDWALNKGINAEFAERNSKPIDIPKFKLQKVVTDKNCNASFDWNIIP